MSQNYTSNPFEDDALIPDIAPTKAKAPTYTEAPQYTETQPASSSMFSAHYYKKYFDLTTDEFFRKFVSALNPLDSQIDEKDGELYGPVWLTAFVILILFISTTMSGIISSWKNSEDVPYEYDFGMLTGAFFNLYGYTFLVPLATHLALVYYLKKECLTLVKKIEIYGYSNSIWTLCALVNIFRSIMPHTVSSILKWVAVAVGCAVSGWDIFSKLGPVLKERLDDKKQFTVTCTLLVLAHLWFSVAVKITFFGDLSII